MALSPEKLQQTLKLLEDHKSATGEDIKPLTSPAGAASVASIDAVSVKVPPFWTSNPSLWFLRLEAQFHNANISQDETKFFHVVGNLDDQVSEEIEDFLTNPPETGKYKALKDALISAYGRTQAQKDAELLAITSMGDRRPSAFLRYLQRLNGDKDTLLRALFLRHLPDNVKTNLAGHTVPDIKELAKKADDIFDASCGPVSAVHNDVAAVGNKYAKYRRPTGSDTAASGKPARKEYICHYHKKFGPDAQNCFPWCMLWTAGPKNQGNGQAGRG